MNIEKCKKCIWRIDVKDEEKIFCPFANCICKEINDCVEKEDENNATSIKAV